MNKLKSALAMGLLFFTVSANADCGSGVINPITDVSWNCMFPMSIAGVPMGGGEDTPNSHTSTVCTCDQGVVPTVGIRYSLWEPSRLIDTVSEPYCMMPLGTQLGGSGRARLSGGYSRSEDSTRAFQQMHYYIFPVFQILDMFYDIPCIGDEGFDVAMLTELVPTWNNDTLSLIVNPEAILFSNPVTNIACAADATSALTGFPRRELFWCLGSWGNAYPLAGSITATDYMEANAALAARGVYFMGRTGLLWETSDDGCYRRAATIWRKDKYRLQMARPTRDSTCVPIGRDALVWGAGKHDLYDDNFMWVLNRKVDCCMTVW